MSTLRAVSGERHLTPSTAIAAAAQRNCDPKDQCHIHPTLSHTNEECRAQNPELRAKKNKRGKLSGQKGRVNAAIPFEESDSDDFSVAMTALPSSLKVAASVSGLEISKDTLIWDSGASNHFINDRQAFTQLTKLAKPFSFDQAVTKSTLNYGGTARIKVGNLKLTLSEALYSPNSSMNLISAGRVYRLTGISEDREKSMLVKLIRGKQIPIAQLVSVNDISIILPLTEDTKFSSPNLNIVAPVIIKPAVAKLKKCSSADRWHQRLGHVGCERPVLE
ncbi:hypothetical protein K3495_g15833 [Podosphaera aphanis]|nr:hypothetical protein K3495_g15833 [Podosphaera aphanis]